MAVHDHELFYLCGQTSINLKDRSHEKTLFTELGMGMLLWSTVNVSAQNAALKNFPEGSQLQEVGDRIVNKFLKTPHTLQSIFLQKVPLMSLPLHSVNRSVQQQKVKSLGL